MSNSLNFSAAFVNLPENLLFCVDILTYIIYITYYNRLRWLCFRSFWRSYWDTFPFYSSFRNTLLLWIGLTSVLFHSLTFLI